MLNDLFQLSQIRLICFERLNALVSCKLNSNNDFLIAFLLKIPLFRLFSNAWTLPGVKSRFTRSKVPLYPAVSPSFLTALFLKILRFFEVFTKCKETSVVCSVEMIVYNLGF